MKKTFKWLNWTQFTGALNDNLFKMTAVIYLVNVLGQNLTEVLTLCSIIFVTPFILFSNYAGTLADRFSKRRIIIISKWLEVGVLSLAFPAILSGAVWPMYGLLFLLCTQSALFGPAKRGIIPELVEDADLSRANGFLTAATYTAIILGTFLPSWFLGVMHLSYVMVLGSALVLALSGVITSCFIAPVPVAGVKRQASPWILPDIYQAVQNLKKTKWLQIAVYGLVFFGGVMALFQQALVVYGTEVMELSVERSAFLFPLAALGIGIGALLVGHFSKHVIEIGLIPVGALGVLIAAMGMSVACHPVWIGCWIVTMGIACGLYLVPLNAYVQQQVKPESRGEVFGAIGFMSFSAMIVTAGLFYVLRNVLHADARMCIFFTGLMVCIPAVITCIQLPEFLFRFVVIRFVKRLYRIHVSGLDNLPRSGGALLISNHISYTDALLLQAATQRRIRFVMSREMYNKLWLIRPLIKLASTIPIHTSDGPRALINAFKAARAEIEKGYIVCIFPEGKLTLNGTMQKFHKGFERVVKGTDCPIIPAHLGHVWGSFFSFKNGKACNQMPDELPRPIYVRFGKALAATVTADEARMAIEELAAEYATEKAYRPNQTLQQRLLKQVRSHWHKPAMSDTMGMRMTYGKLMTATVALIRRMRPIIKHCRTIGILLPTSACAAMANLAVTLQGKTVVNLNWTAPESALNLAIKESRIKYVITSRRFMQKVAMPELAVRYLYFEDLLKNLRLREKFIAMLQARLARPAWFTQNNEVQPDDIAAIIFSSGSTGTPKGVMLSHANILSNIDSVSEVSPFTKADAMCGVLPFFHSFGFMGTLWWPLLTNLRVAYHANPLQAALVVKMIKEEKLSVLIATPTFLQGYMRKASPTDFESLKTVITGGEKLSAGLAGQFNEKFGIQLLQGYGATELSPVAALSLPNQQIADHQIQGHETGSTGRLLPGIVAKILHPETGACMAPGEDGLLWIKGPNVMQGYLNAPEKTAEVLHAGWYNTGDVAHINAEGFLFLTGRLARFSKIAGEMVPHGAVEEALQTAAGIEEPCIAVVSIADQTKGEQLAVCYTEKAGDAESLISKLRKLDLPNLWIPRVSNFFRIPELPILGTGKLDLCALNAYVKQQ